MNLRKVNPGENWMRALNASTCMHREWNVKIVIIKRIGNCWGNFNEMILWGNVS